MRILSIVLFTALLTACQFGAGLHYPGDASGSAGENNQQEITHFTLNTPFTIRADRASEYIQYGEIKEYRKISEYYPHCIFGLRTISDQARTVQPDTFTVTHIHRDRFTAESTHKIMLASLAGGGDGYNMVMSTTNYNLHSDEQPDVFRVSCQQLDEPYRVRHVYNSEIIMALGEMFSVGIR